MKPTDKALLTACRRGDETAWEQLVGRYQRLIYAIPRRAGLDDDAAAEVFQEVFTTLFLKLDDIEEPERLHAWLVTTAKRKTWRLISKGRNRQQVSIDDREGSDGSQIDQLPDDAPLAVEVMLELEQQHRIRAALNALDDRCRQLLRLLFYEPVPPSYTDIATALGISTGSIGPTRARCLKKMLPLLEPNQAGGEKT